MFILYADNGSKWQSFHVDVVQRCSCYFPANWFISNKCGGADLVCTHLLAFVCFIKCPWLLEVVNAMVNTNLVAAVFFVS